MKTPHSETGSMSLHEHLIKIQCSVKWVRYVNTCIPVIKTSVIQNVLVSFAKMSLDITFICNNVTWYYFYM